MGFISDFKKFAMRGNVVDMAVGIIIGAAFGAIVTSLVEDMIMPPIGALLGNMDFSELAVTIKKATVDTPIVELRYGKFIQTIINFIIIAFSVFLLIRVVNKLQEKDELAPVAPAGPSKEEVILGEIRDLLKDKK